MRKKPNEFYPGERAIITLLMIFEDKVSNLELPSVAKENNVTGNSFKVFNYKLNH